MAFPESLKLVGRAAGPSVDVIVESSIACEVVGWTMEGGQRAWQSRAEGGQSCGQAGGRQKEVEFIL